MIISWSSRFCRWLLGSGITRYLHLQGQGQGQGQMEAAGIVVVNLQGDIALQTKILHNLNIPEGFFSLILYQLYDCFFCGSSTRFRDMACPNGGFTITLRHATVGRTPLDEWSARRRELYLTVHKLIRDKHPCPRRDSNPQNQQASSSIRRP